MESPSATSCHHVQPNRKDFLLRFRKNLFIESKSAIKELLFCIAVLRVTSVGVSLFIMEFEVTKKVLAVVSLPFLVFLVGKYLTLLPMIIVFTLIALAFHNVLKRGVVPILGLAAITSFFITFLI